MSEFVLHISLHQDASISLFNTDKILRIFDLNFFLPNKSLPEFSLLISIWYVTILTMCWCARSQWFFLFLVGMPFLCYIGDLFVYWIIYDRNISMMKMINHQTSIKNIYIYIYINPSSIKINWIKKLVLHFQSDTLKKHVVCQISYYF